MGSAAIELRAVEKTYRIGGGEVPAVACTSLAVETGQFVAIVGPSGCGKSTLLRLIAGLIRPTAGAIAVGGTVVEKPVTDLGIVFQVPVLLDWLNVLDNILVQVELRRLPRAAYLQQAQALLAAVGLGDFQRAFPRELSGGMKQRAAIVRSLIHDPPLLLMDEPFGALDALTREQIRVDLEELWLSRRKTVIFITHSIDEAVLLADRVVVMSPRPGRIEEVLDVDLPRPRGLEGRELPGFAALNRRITGIFLERGVLQSRQRLVAV